MLIALSLVSGVQSLVSVVQSESKILVASVKYFNNF